MQIVCSMCGRSQGSPLLLECTECSIPFTLSDYPTFRKGEIISDVHNLWRYRRFFPYVRKQFIVSMGEGHTPKISLDQAGRVEAILEYMNPTHSFKDRGTTMLISTLNQRHVSKIIEDSSGNAGASIAAYSARAGISCTVFVPESAPPMKLRQIKSYGAKVTKVAGAREDVARKARQAGSRSFYASHVYNPQFLDGMRSIAYQIGEQYSWNLPDFIYLPVSAGTSLLGLVYGLKNLESSGVTSKLPTIVAVQPSNVSPLHHALIGRNFEPIPGRSSVADALTGVSPARLFEMVQALRSVKGTTEIVSEKEIIESQRFLGRKGMYVEPSSATTYAALRKNMDRGVVTPNDRSLLIITGSGLKSSV